ncbi:MAG: hypothetical protein LRY73_03105 [Bacillus sp. (in: Bacteria)]|nr:hypothetical protein [Bacillus sp. (in: firmicutes)]
MLRFVSTKAETEDPAGKKSGNGFARCSSDLRSTLKSDIKPATVRTLLRLLKRRRTRLFQFPPRRLRRCPRKASSRRSHQHVTILIK